MFNVIANGLIALIERELVKHSPEIEAMALKQLEAIGNKILDYIDGKSKHAVDTTRKKYG